MVQQRKMAAPAYLVGAAVLVIPPFDSLMQMLPLKISDAKWRYGAYGLASSSLMLALLGLLVVMLTAVVFEHRRTQRVLGILAIVAAVALIIGFGLFTLDMLQVRSEVPPNSQMAYRIASLEALVKAVLGIVTLFLFGTASLKAPKPLRAPAPAARGPGGLVLGSNKGAQTRSAPAAETE